MPNHHKNQWSVFIKIPFVVYYFIDGHLSKSLVVFLQLHFWLNATNLWSTKVEKKNENPHSLGYLSKYSYNNIEVSLEKNLMSWDEVETDKQLDFLSFDIFPSSPCINNADDEKKNIPESHFIVKINSLTVSTAWWRFDTVSGQMPNDFTILFMYVHSCSQVKKKTAINLLM